jgi:hypothetical protein
MEAIAVEIDKKECNKCKNPYPATLEYFYQNQSEPDGLNRTCKLCVQRRTAERKREKHERYLQSKVGHIYFILAPLAGLIKIGFAGKDPKIRLTNLSNMSPIPLILVGSIKGSFVTERDLHLRFEGLRSHGEWFRLSPELQTFLVEQFGPLQLP